MSSKLLLVGSEAERKAIIDRYGDLDREVQAFKPKADEHESLKKQIKSWYENEPAELSALAVGDRYEIQVGVKGIERKWTSMVKLQKAFGGVKAFLKACTVSIQAAEAAIGKDKVEALLEEERTGSRRLKVVAKAPAIAPAA